MRSRPARVDRDDGEPALAEGHGARALAGGQADLGGKLGRAGERRETDDKQATIVMTPTISVAVSAVTSQPQLAQAARLREIVVRPGVLSPMSEPFRQLRVTLGPAPGERLDKALAAAVPEALALRRSRLQGLIVEGAVASADGRALVDPRPGCGRAPSWC